MFGLLLIYLFFVGGGGSVSVVSVGLGPGSLALAGPASFSFRLLLAVVARPRVGDEPCRPLLRPLLRWPPPLFIHSFIFTLPRESRSALG